MDLEELNIDQYQYVSTPGGGDYNTCPKCSSDCDADHSEVFEKYYVDYCTKCMIFFGYCCSWSVNGCSDDLYYPTFLHLTTVPKFT